MIKPVKSIFEYIEKTWIFSFQSIIKDNNVYILLIMEMSFDADASKKCHDKRNVFVALFAYETSP